MTPHDITKGGMVSILPDLVLNRLPAAKRGLTDAHGELSYLADLIELGQREGRPVMVDRLQLAEIVASISALSAQVENLRGMVGL